MKTNIGQKGNKKIAIKKVSKHNLSILPGLIKNNISFNAQTKTGHISYIANLDGTRGILSKVENGVPYIFERERWVQI